MDILKNEPNEHNENIEESIITLQDFPFICRICCLKRSDLRLFEDEHYLLDLFHTIRRIDVLSASHFPKNICDECINKLEDISTFIETSKLYDERLGKNMIPKVEIECVETIERKTSVEHETSRVLSGTNEENKEDMYLQKSKICRICLSPSSLIPFVENLMQLFRNITNIDVKPEINFVSRDCICETCFDKLEEISSFISLSLFNDGKLENVVGRNTTVKFESYAEENPINIHMKFESVSGQNEKLIDNNAFSYEINKKIESIDIKEEVIDSELASSTMKNYQNNSELHFLTQTEDNEGKPFKCVYCERCFSRKVNLQRHSLIHTREKPFKCACCERCFSRKVNLQRHSLIHTRENPFKCDYCEKSFFHKIILQRHLSTHSKEKPFKCDRCEKSFTRKCYLQQHLPIHTGLKPFKCDCCEKSFSCKNNLDRHFFSHTRPFKCDNCEKSFARKLDLKRHLLTRTVMTCTELMNK